MCGERAQERSPLPLAVNDDFSTARAAVAHRCFRLRAPTRFGIGFEEEVRRSIWICARGMRYGRDGKLAALGEGAQGLGIDVVEVLGKSRQRGNVVHVDIAVITSVGLASSQAGPKARVTHLCLYFRLGACVAIPLAAVFWYGGHRRRRGDRRDDRGHLCDAFLVNLDFDFNILLEVRERSAQGAGEGWMVRFEKRTDAFVMESM